MADSTFSLGLQRAPPSKKTKSQRRASTRPQTCTRRQFDDSEGSSSSESSNKVQMMKANRTTNQFCTDKNKSNVNTYERQTHSDYEKAKIRTNSATTKACRDVEEYCDCSIGERSSANNKSKGSFDAKTIKTRESIPNQDREDEVDDAIDDELLETPKPLFDEEESVNEKFLDIPYTQAINFDPDLNNLDDKISNEPIRPGDVIEYYSPMFVVGDKRGLRQATVLGVTPDADIILDLSNGECLPADTNVKRIKVMDGDELFDHPGIYRSIDTFKLVLGKVEDGASGIMNEAARFGEIFRKNLVKVQANAEADGFALMDMFRTVQGGRKVNDHQNLNTTKLSSKQCTTPNHHEAKESISNLLPSLSSESHAGLTSKRVCLPSKPSYPSQNKTMNCSDEASRHTFQGLQHSYSSSSSSSSDNSANLTLNQIKERKYALQDETPLKPKEQNVCNHRSNVDKENVNNSCHKKRGTISCTHYASIGPSVASSPASLGPSLASSASLGSSLASSSSEDGSIGDSLSKYRKITSNISLPRETISSVDLSSESFSDGSSKWVRNQTPITSVRRNPLSEDDISDSENEIHFSNKRNVASKKRMYQSM